VARVELEDEGRSGRSDEWEWKMYLDQSGKSGIGRCRESGQKGRAGLEDVNRSK
jgi:hypothetical protein